MNVVMYLGRFDKRSNQSNGRFHVIHGLTLLCLLYCLLLDVHGDDVHCVKFVGDTANQIAGLRSCRGGTRHWRMEMVVQFKL